MPPEADLGIVLVSGDHARVHAALLFASGAAALGRQVTVFATGQGVLGLCTDLGRLAAEGQDRIVRDRGVAGLAELRAACCELGVTLIACPSGLRGCALEEADLLPSVSVGGMSSFLEATPQAQLLSF